MTDFVKFCPKCYALFRDSVLYQQHIETCNKVQQPDEWSVIQSPQPTIKSKSVQNKPKRARRSKAARRGILAKAIDFYCENPSLPLSKIAKMFGLETHALSKPQALLLMEQRQPKTSGSRPAISKMQADDWRYNEKR